MPAPNPAPALEERKVTAPMLLRAAETQPSSYREEDNSIEVCWSTGASVLRFDWWDGEYYNEELDMSDGAVRLDRLNSGGPVLDTHSSYRLSSVIGSVEPGSVRIENGQGLARVRLANTDDVKDTVEKIRDGHIRNLSVGYIVHQYTRIEEDGKRPVMRADDWEPTEISFVPVPADAGAQVRSLDAEQGGFPCIIRGVPSASQQENTMPTPNPQGAPAGAAGQQRQPSAAPAVVEPTPTPAPAASIDEPGQRKEPQSVTSNRIRDVVRRADLGDTFALDLIARNEETPLTEAALTDAIGEELEKKRNVTPVNSNVRLGANGTESDAYRSAVSNALMLRSNPSLEMSAEEREAAREFRGLSLIEMARDYLECAGISTRGMDRMTLAGAALGMRGGMISTSDFAHILQNTANKRLRRAYEAAPQTFRPFISTGTLPDFKAAPIVGMGDAPELLLVLENGEFQRGSVADFGDSYKLATYGRIIGITRQVIVNDDLRVLDRIPAGFGQKAADLESDMVYAPLLNNVTMYDNTALFHADHGNLAGSGTIIDEASLDAGTQAMMTQTSPEGTPLNLMPRYLIVGPKRKVQAQKMLTAITPNASGSVNVFQNSLELIVEGRITDYSWFLSADPAQIETIELASLEGQEGVHTDSRVGFDVDGIELKARTDRVAKALDWRGFYKNPGAAS